MINLTEFLLLIFKDFSFDETSLKSRYTSFFQIVNS